jgi:hypothetical protein
MESNGGAGLPEGYSALGVALTLGNLERGGAGARNFNAG